MPEEKFCDFCGRFEHELPEPADTKQPKLTIDEDGLWACVDCRPKLTNRRRLAMAGKWNWKTSLWP